MHAAAHLQRYATGIKAGAREGARSSVTSATAAYDRTTSHYVRTARRRTIDPLG
jgi:hypothetical protein